MSRLYLDRRQFRDRKNPTVDVADGTLIAVNAASPPMVSRMFDRASAQERNHE
jgi:hypothetical protein